jgi:transcriptional regulator with XRE-family HTH domain
MLLAQQIRQLRDQSGFSLQDLAKRAGFKTTFISQLERGEQIPSCCDLDTISEALQVPLYRLFYDQQPPATPWLTPRISLEEYFKKTGGFSAKVRLRNTVRVLYSAVISLL